MYTQVSVLPVTGIGMAASGGAAYAFGGFWIWAFTIIALFTLIGAVGAFVRTVPPLKILYREPKQLAPKGLPERPGR